MRRTLLILSMALACGGLTAKAQAGISALCSVSSAAHAIRTQTGEERMQQAIGLRYVAADLRHI